MINRAYMSLCDRCFDKINKTRVASPVSREFMSCCPQCGQKKLLIQYAIGPTYHELDILRKRRQADEKKRKNAGNSERARAERRARE